MNFNSPKALQLNKSGKILLLFILLTFMASPSYAQVDSLALSFLKSVITKEKIVYVDSINTMFLGDLKKAVIANRNLYLKNRHKPIDTIKLKKFLAKLKGVKPSAINLSKYSIPNKKIPFTAEEKAYICDKLDNLKNHAWPRGLFENSVMLTKQDLDTIFHSKNNPNPDRWGNFYKNYGEGYYEFSNPIFIRKNTICIFYKLYLCGYLCGDAQLSVYELRGSNWEKSAILFAVDF